MFSHIVVIKIRWEVAEIEVTKTKFPNFSLVGVFPYWALYMYCKRLSVRAKISWKWFFSKVDLLVWEYWEVDSMMEIDQLDPKWLPKSLVWPYPSWNPEKAKYPHIVSHVPEWNDSEPFWNFRRFSNGLFSTKFWKSAPSTKNSMWDTGKRFAL